MKILDSLKDIVKHTTGLGIIKTVKLIGTKNTTKIEAIDEDFTVVIYGEMNSPIPKLDKTVGLSRINILKGYVDNPAYSTDDAKVVIVTEDRDGTKLPAEISFESEDGSTSNYRFMSESMINEQIKLPPFKDADWDVVINPEKKKISELSYNYNVLGSVEKRFTVKTSNGNLKFCIGSGPTDRSEVVFAKNVTGTMKNDRSWPLAVVLNVLRLSESSASTVISFSDSGCIKIDIDSGIGKYSYIILAARK